MDTIGQVKKLCDELGQSQTKIEDKGYFRHGQYELIDMLFLAVNNLNKRVEHLESLRIDDGR